MREALFTLRASEEPSPPSRDVPLWVIIIKNERQIESALTHDMYETRTVVLKQVSGFVVVRSPVLSSINKTFITGTKHRIFVHCGYNA